MVAVFAAVLSWESSSAQSLLLAAQSRYANSQVYEGRVSYHLNKTRMSATPGPGATETRDYVITRKGGRYEVRPEDGKPWRGASSEAVTDPYLAYDHEITRWLGFRKKRLVTSLLPPDAKGPVFSMIGSKALPKGCIGVRETYTVPGLPDFFVTTVIDEATLAIRMVNSFGAVTDSADSGPYTAERQGVIWSETLELSEQRF